MQYVSPANNEVLGSTTDGGGSCSWLVPSYLFNAGKGVYLGERFMIWKPGVICDRPKPNSIERQRSLRAVPRRETELIHQGRSRGIVQVADTNLRAKKQRKTKGELI